MESTDWASEMLAMREERHEMAGEMRFPRPEVARRGARATPTAPTILVGERANGDTAERPGKWPSHLPELRIRHSAFRWGPCRERLMSLGLRWDSALNLLPRGAGSSVAWDQEEAERCAALLWPLAAGTGARLVIAGARACSAMGIKYEPLLRSWADVDATYMGLGEERPASKPIRVEILVVAHPSGRCLWWNHRDHREAAAQAFAAWHGRPRPHPMDDWCHQCGWVRVDDKPCEGCVR